VIIDIDDSEEDTMHSGRYDPMAARKIISKAMNITESVDVDRVENIIKNSKFDWQDHDNGTTGFCGTFAIALHRHLNKLGIPNQIVVLHEAGPGYSDQDFAEHEVFWSHFAIKAGDNFYDVTGKIDIDSAHDEFGTDKVRVVSEASTIKMVRDLDREQRSWLRTPGNPGAYSSKKYRDWKKRLYDPLRGEA
jgi:threonine synthase